MDVSCDNKPSSVKYVIARSKEYTQAMNSLYLSPLTWVMASLSVAGICMATLAQVWICTKSHAEVRWQVAQW